MEVVKCVKNTREINDDRLIIKDLNITPDKLIYIIDKIQINFTFLNVSNVYL